MDMHGFTLVYVYMHAHIYIYIFTYVYIIPDILFLFRLYLLFDSINFPEQCLAEELPWRSKNLAAGHPSTGDTTRPQEKNKVLEHMKMYSVKHM